MATIGSLVVNLTARTATFDKKLKRSGRNVNSLSRQMQSFKSMLLGATAAVGAFVGVRALTSMVRNTMTAIDATAKLSDRLGIATEDLIKLRHAATITGVSVESLDNALSILVRRMGEASQGSGEATRGLEMLGLTAQELTDAGPAESVRIIADQINNLTNQSEKAAAAYFLFGRQGQALVNMMAQGRAGIEALGDEAERLGLTFDRVDAAKIEAANDAITRMDAALTGVKQTLAIVLAPYIEAAVQKFTEMGISGEHSGDLIFSAVRKVTTGIAYAADGVQYLKIGFKTLQIVAAGAMWAILTPFEEMETAIRSLLSLLGVEVPSMVANVRQALGEEIESLGRDIEVMSQNMPSTVVRGVFDQIEADAEVAAQAVADAATSRIAPLTEMEAPTIDDDASSKISPLMGISGTGVNAMMTVIPRAMEASPLQTEQDRQTMIAEESLNTNRQQVHILQRIADAMRDGVPVGSVLN